MYLASGFSFCMLTFCVLLLECSVWKEQESKEKLEWNVKQASGLAGGRDNFLFASCTKTNNGLAMLSPGIAMAFL